MATEGIFEPLIRSRRDSTDLIATMKGTAERLVADNGANSAPHHTEGSHPAMLLGKIQSGKTRAFIGIIAKAFDEGLDFAIILTKGTSALSEQTLKRVTSDFKEAIAGERVLVFDIMHLPKNLTNYHLKQKWVIIAKKQKDNLGRIFAALQSLYPDLQQKRLLIIDDEADYATLTYKKKADTDEIEPGKIAKWVDDLRSATAATHFLQVTATPYSLYLQPNDAEDRHLFHPVRPAFTELLPTYEGYIGGDFFFGESAEDDSLARYVYEEVPLEERDTLKKEDRRSFKIEDALQSNRIAVLRRALVNFVVGGCVRRWQQEKVGTNRERYSFIVHTEQGRSAHAWQDRIVKELVRQLITAAKEEAERCTSLVTESYSDLARSLSLLGDPYPDSGEVLSLVRQALVDEYAIVSVVNSDNQVRDLLDEDGQLKLSAPLNIFIGGQILDRGITIRNLIGFYYGRNPRQFQQDTVLQHARLYGSRPKGDLAATRFYTTNHIHEIMRRIHEFDSALRQAIERGDQLNGVYFLRRDDQGQVIPCSPNKVLVSDLVTLRQNSRHLPIGFQTGFKSNIGKAVAAIDESIHRLLIPGKPDDPVLIGVEEAEDILKLIEKTLVFADDDYQWDFDAHVAALKHMTATYPAAAEMKGKVWMLVREGRDLARVREDGRFSNAPDSYQEIQIARRVATDVPMLTLIRQNGRKEQGWHDVPFWWPIITTPGETLTTIFASKTRGE